MQLNFQTSLCQNVIAVTKDFRMRSRVDNNKALKTVRETLTSIIGPYIKDLKTSLLLGPTFDLGIHFLADFTDSGV